MQPRSTAILSGGEIPLDARFQSEKKVNNAEVAALIAGELWKKEGKKKGAKKGEESKTTA